MKKESVKVKVNKTEPEKVAKMVETFLKDDSDATRLLK